MSERSLSPSWCDHSHRVSPWIGNQVENRQMRRVAHLTYLGSQSRVTECLAPKYEPTGERMTKRVAWLAGPRPRVGSVPIIVGLE